ncbi:hypothetical protein RF11_09283 [Thelohanellus kitauei]|uniref:Uncharacterized protein n=1 Tax=Thelohanellus kitauei TaxID=669202 RepID=A0A0C2J6S9_THEKT|nr:hypothetical protein RF11_09283 [Thelohanellus kitauei]
MNTNSITNVAVTLNQRSLARGQRENNLVSTLHNLKNKNTSVAIIHETSFVQSLAKVLNMHKMYCGHHIYKLKIHGFNKTSKFHLFQLFGIFIIQNIDFYPVKMKLKLLSHEQNYKKTKL